MRALHVTRLDGPGFMDIVDIAPPLRQGNEVLIDVRAAGLAFPDLLLTRGAYQLRPDLPFVPGSEVAGLVLEAPLGSGFQPGDRVAAYTHLSGFQSLATAPADRVFTLPDNVSFAVGAALPMNYFTAHFALRVRGRLAEGETVLVHGAGGGVGVAVIQLARAWRATTIAVTSDAAKSEVARRAGADHVIPVDHFREAVHDLTDGHGVDIVADPVGGDRVTDSLRSLAPLGRLLILGFTAGEIPTVKVNRLLLNNIDVVGVGFGAYALQRDGYMGAQWQELLPLLGNGALRPLVTLECRLEDIPAVLASMENRTLTGKAVAIVGQA
ncbi:MAG: NADPH:quinone oxidoreductase family protein [Candidatus Nanopelagicales bacterium]